MNVQIEESWYRRLQHEWEKPYFSALTQFVRDEYVCTKVYPHPKNIFRAFDLCPFTEVKVVILGQDPYHGVGQANGLCFAVNEGVAMPPSLQNIFKEINLKKYIEPFLLEWIPTLVNHKQKKLKFND